MVSDVHSGPSGVNGETKLSLQSNVMAAHDDAEPLQNKTWSNWVLTSKNVRPQLSQMSGNIL